METQGSIYAIFYYHKDNRFLSIAERLQIYGNSYQISVTLVGRSLHDY